jgi:drug/metabolite transporter (DMT)-like permease
MATLKTQTKQKHPRLKAYGLLHAVIFLYSLAAVCSKSAAQYEVLSLPFVLWYLGALVLLAVYALVWQQILKQIPLTSAYANKGASMIWGFFWGALLFAEHISIAMLIGAAVVFAGVLLVVTADE